MNKTVSDLRKNRLDMPNVLSVFVDGFSLFDQNRRLNYDALYKGIVGNRIVSKAVYYIIAKEKDLKNFSIYITQCGFEIRYKKGEVDTLQDISMTLDAVNMVDKCEVLALVTNRPETFSDLAKHLIDRGIVVENWSFSDVRRSYAYSYTYSIDQFIENLQGNP